MNDPVPSTTEPDWSREYTTRFKYDPGRRLLRAIRRYQLWKARGGLFAWLMCKWLVLEHRRWSRISGADIPLNAQLGGGLLLPHPVGVVIHPDARVGPNGLIFQGVALGSGGPIPGAPRIGGHVDIGAGAKLLGGITVGDHAKIGANAVVLCDVPTGATAVGIPARIIAGNQAGR